MVHRTVFKDNVVTDGMRAERTIIKGRFLNGTIGYVLAKDLELYANTFLRPIQRLSYVQRTVLDTVIAQSPTTARLIKEETGLLNKSIMPALHRLQEAFLVYEDQVDADWERGWYDFATEWPDVYIEQSRWEPAAATVLTRFLKGYVFATLENIKDWSGLPVKKLQGLVAMMEKSGTVVPTEVEGLGEGWMLPENTSLGRREEKPSVFMLHKSDVLVRSSASELKRRFGIHEVLQYLLIDGQLLGAVLGHWRRRPYDVEDIVVDLPTRDRITRRDEILNAVRWGYGQPRTNILRYDGNNIS